MNPTADLLRSALALIEQPEHWCQGSYNKDRNGNEFVANEDAVCWCAEGACLHIAGHYDAEPFPEAFDAITSVIGTNGLTTWNDAPERTHAEVIAAFRRAIAIAEGGA